MSYSEVNTVEKLEELASRHLGYEERVLLASSNPRFRFLMPLEQMVGGDDFITTIWSPTVYPQNIIELEIPILSRGLLKINLHFRWFTQDNPTISMRLIRDGKRFTRFYTFSLLPPDDFSWQTVNIIDHDLVKMAKRGDILKVTRRGIRDDDFALRISHKHET